MRRAATTTTARGIAAMLSASAVFLGLSVAVPATASADGWGCAGAQIDSYPVTAGTLKMGTVYLYWDNNTGRNCAVNVAYGSFYGRQKQMSISMYPCAYDAEGYCDQVSPTATDDGPYRYYAGPVSVPARGLCIALLAQIDDPYYGVGQAGPFNAVHCK